MGKKGVIYGENVRLKNFEEQKRDFMMGKEKGKIVLRQLNGHPIDPDETRLNNFLISRIKAVRYIQLQSGSEKLEKGTDLHKLIEQEVENGIILNGMEISADTLYGRPKRSRRRK